MSPAMKRIVEEVKSIVQENPGDGIDPGTALQVEIVKDGEAFSEDDVLEAALAVGVPEDDLISFMEDLGGWV